MSRASQIPPFLCAIWVVIGACTLPSAQAQGNRLAAANHTMALDSDGYLAGSGKNLYSQLGIGDRFDRAMFHRHPDETVWTDVWCSLNSTVTRKPDGSLWTSNQAGIPEAPFTRIGSENAWAMAALGYTRTAALKSDGSLWAWGTGAHGIIGLPLYATLELPTRVGADTNWQTIATGGDSSLGIKTDGSLWSWGTNDYGKLGTGWISPGYQPTRIGSLVGWRRIAIGHSHSLAIRDDGSLWSWGGNYNGQLGVGSTVVSYSPVRVGTANDWLEISAGESHTLALKTDHSLWAWGRNDFGQLGLGNNLPRTSPERVGTGLQWQCISGGVTHSSAMTSGGTVWTWGDNGSGQLGDATSGRNIPLPAPNVETPDISVTFVQEPKTSDDLMASGTRTCYFQRTATGLPLTTNFTVLNHGTGPLVVHDVVASAGFSTGSITPITVAPGQAFQLPVILDTSVTGEVAGVLRIHSNDADESEFTFNLTGSVLSELDDTDADGLNDALEWKLSELGFSWQVPDQGRLATFQNNAHRAGLLTKQQLRVRDPGSTLLECEPVTGVASARLRLERSSTLNAFARCDLTGAAVNPTGQLLIPVPRTDPAGFFRFAIEPLPVAP